MQFSGESIVAFSDHFEKGIGVSQRVVFRRSKSDDLPQTQAGYGNPWGSLGKRSTNFVDLLLICRRISSSLVYILIYIYIIHMCIEQHIYLWYFRQETRRPHEHLCCFKVEADCRDWDWGWCRYRATLASKLSLC